MKYAAYARSKGIEIGSYSLLASRSVGGGNDVVMPPGQSPAFGNSPCLGSAWGASTSDSSKRITPAKSVPQDSQRGRSQAAQLGFFSSYQRLRRRR